MNIYVYTSTFIPPIIACYHLYYSQRLLPDFARKDGADMDGALGEKPVSNRSWVYKK